MKSTRERNAALDVKLLLFVNLLVIAKVSYIYYLRLIVFIRLTVIDFSVIIGAASCFLMSHPDATCSAQNQPNMILSKQGADNGVEVSRSIGIVR